MQRCDWDDLPEAVRHEVGRRCGPIGKVRPVAAGMNNAATGVLELDSGGGPVFFKGLRIDDPRVWMYRNEVTAAEAGAPGPALRWVVEADEWILLGWDHIDGRHADLGPGSPDLDSVAKALHRLAGQPPLSGSVGLAPESRRWERMLPWAHLTTQPPETLDPWVVTNLTSFADRERDILEALDGPFLAHTDLHELNLLIGDGHAHLIDWAWSRRAAPWVDAEMFTLRLVAAGHSVGEADAWRMASLPHSDIDLDTRRDFAAEMLGIWLHLAQLRPNRTMFGKMAGHALRWAKHLHQIG